MSIIHRWCFYIAVYAVVFLWTSFMCLKLLLDLLRHPVIFFRRPKRRLTPPQCLLDESLGKHEYVRANGIKFHYVTSGDESKPLMLFLHGFPEFWYSWRHQIRAFSADYHVVAVDLRGYGETEHPPKTRDYAITNLSQDIVQLIPALGHSDAILVAHDWGGGVAWEVAQKKPELLKKLIIINSPHPRAFKMSASQLLKSWYMFFFQVPWLPEFALSQRDCGFLYASFHGKKGGVRNKDAFTLEDLEAYKYVFSQPGAFTGPINYYRCVFGKSLFEAKKVNIKVPTLIIWGDDDMFLESCMADAHGEFVSDLTVKHIPKCSHWAQQDQPERVNQCMRDFI